MFLSVLPSWSGGLEFGAAFFCSPRKQARPVPLVASGMDSAMPMDPSSALFPKPLPVTVPLLIEMLAPGMDSAPQLDPLFAFFLRPLPPVSPPLKLVALEIDSAPGMDSLFAFRLYSIRILNLRLML